MPENLTNCRSKGLATGLLLLAYFWLTRSPLCISSPLLFTGVVHYTVEGRPPNEGSGKILEAVDDPGNDITCYRSRVCNSHHSVWCQRMACLTSCEQ